jgi:hypothetical protein
MIVILCIYLSSRSQLDNVNKNKMDFQTICIKELFEQGFIVDNILKAHYLFLDRGVIVKEAQFFFIDNNANYYLAVKKDKNIPVVSVISKDVAMQIFSD